jgi:hypothetical protein
MLSFDIPSCLDGNRLVWAKILGHCWYPK